MPETLGRNCRKRLAYWNCSQQLYCGEFPTRGCKCFVVFAEVHRLSDSDIQISQGSPIQMGSVAALLPDSAAHNEKAASPRSKLERCKSCVPKCRGRAKKLKKAKEPGAPKASDESAKRSRARKQGRRGQVPKALVIPKAPTTARSAVSVASDISDQHSELPSCELRGASTGLRERLAKRTGDGSAFSI